MNHSGEGLNVLLSRAFEASGSGIIVGSSVSPRRPVVHVNPAVEQITGIPAVDMIGRDFWSVFGNDSGMRLRTRIQRVFSKTVRQVVSFSHHPDGRSVWVQISVSPVRNMRGKETHYVAILEDVTDQKIAEQRLTFLAVHDSLTGLPNRNMVEELLSQGLAAHSRRRKRLCVVFIDLDHFKIINDTLGHASGDALLRQVAGRFRQRLRSSDSIARLGGDEFVVIFADIDEPAAVKTLAEKILECFSHPFDLDGHEVAVSASLGLTLFPDHGANPKELLKNADGAMYQAKSQGRNTYRIFSPKLKRGGGLSVPAAGGAAC